MTRINVYTYPEPGTEEWDRLQLGRQSAELAGHFTLEKAELFSEDTDWDGSNRISVATGTQWDHQMLLRTAGNRWVLNRFSSRQGNRETYEFITDDQAREWLLRNHADETVTRFFGPVEEERGPGRPEIGGMITVRLGDLLGPLDGYVTAHQTTRAEAIRSMVRAGLADYEMG